MKPILAVLVPPVAACRYGCAGCCAAPIGVFWIAGIVSLVYGYNGGPLGLDTVSWSTLGLGAALWGIAVIWTLITLHNTDDDRCQKKTSTLCSKIVPRLNESDPLDEVRKAR
jgi:hypothetical protein